MIINNFNQIKELLTFPNDDCFYHLQILKREKDCPEHERVCNNNARCVKTYYIKNLEYLESKKAEIIGLCEMFNARAYINLNTKSFEKAALQLTKEMVNRIIFKQYEHAYRAYETVVGSKESNTGDKVWVIDVDTKDIVILLKTITEINKCQSSKLPLSNGMRLNVITKIPTVNGWHIITHPFNTKQIEPFQCKYPFDIQRNNPTLLYFNKK